MSYRVDNAVIMAAGTSSRFAPLSYEKPKALITVKGEVLIERQIRQLQEAGIKEIIIVTGYKKEQFEYLKEKYGVILVENGEYLTRNNNGSIYAVRDYLRNTFICSADNYFTYNPFENEVEESYYAALYASGQTKEWCMKEDEEGYICDVQIGGENAWYMLGHVFWSEEFSSRFRRILERIYDEPNTKDLLWESIYIQYINELKMKIRHYEDDFIFEFDTLDELRKFDTTYVEDSRSAIIKEIAAQLKCRGQDIINITAVKEAGCTEANGFHFQYREQKYEYYYHTKECCQMLI